MFPCHLQGRVAASSGRERRAVWVLQEGEEEEEDDTDDR